jgi:Ca-activated chloride channel homolog
MKIKNFRGILLLISMMGLSMIACSLFDFSSDGPPGDAVVIEVVANSSLEPWMATAVSNFNAAAIENSSGNPFYVTYTIVDAGQAVTQLTAGATTALWIPDEEVWVNLLADQGNSNFQGDCISVAESPLVIGMWRDVAEALGWPGLPLGWLDIGSLAADSSAWNYYSGGQLGDAFRLGHTHPGLSGTGASTLLAVVQAAQAKTDAVTIADIQQPIVQASVGAFESGVTWFSSDTMALGSTMSERGVTYLTAGIMYESTVLQYGNEAIVPVYPLEGTFMATFPACINQASDSDAQAAADAFRQYLLDEQGQNFAVGAGLRPVNDAVSIGSPLDVAHGVDLTQPVNVFNAPSVDTIYAVQELWQEARKDVNLVMLLDTSGSMRGSKMTNMLEAAVQFVAQMGDDDFISVIGFSTEPYLVVEHQRLGDGRQKVINAINSLRAEGDTTLFDAIGAGTNLIADTSSVDTTNALVVLTDGQDTRSYRYTSETAAQAALDGDMTIFAIAYGSDADERTLSSLATDANGNFYQGDEASINTIYEEMSAAFGGTVGVGR